MNPISGYIVICLIITLGYFVGLLNYLSDYETKKCEVTYMFEYPQFVRISNRIDKIYPKYELYAYSEGRLTERARNMYFDGIPVLFIPGNAGSYKQVRSLSSIALRKALNSRSSFHLDYFTVNLNKEYSGLNGALLYDQLDYVNSSVYRVLSLYKNRKNPPKSVVLIGHSMGGVIARSLLSFEPTNSTLFPIVLALAAPLKHAPILLDYHMNSFYKNIQTKNLHPHSTFVSISGGFSDLLIPSALSNLRDNNSLNIVSTNIPLSWLQANHVQILWCKQVILAINRALFDSVDVKTDQISTDPLYRKTVFQHHLIENSGTRVQQRRYYSEKSTFKQNKGEWIETVTRKYSVQLKQGLRQPHWYMVRLTKDRMYEAVTVVAINLEVVDWAFVCGAHFARGPQFVCEEGYHLSHLSEISPSAKYKRRTLRVNLHELKKKNDSTLSHVVFRALPTSEPVIFHVDIYGLGERTFPVDLPRWWSMQLHTIVHETIEKAVHYDLLLPQLQHVLQSYRLFLEPFECTTDYHHATISLIVPWAHENFHGFVTDDDIKPFDLRLYTSRPQGFSENPAFIRLTLEPTCKYRISVKSSILGMLGQMARNYTNLLLANIAVVVLLTFRTQLRNIGKHGQCTIFFSAMKEGVKPYYILTSVKLLTRMLSSPAVTKYLPVPDWLLIVEEGGDFFLLPLLLYMCSVGIVWLLAVVFLVSLVALESTVNKLALRFLAKTVTFTVSWSDHLMSMFHKLPFLVAGFLIFLCLSTCGSLALCLGMVFYFLKLTQMSQDFIEEVVWFFAKKFARRCKQAFSKSKTDAVVKPAGNNETETSNSEASTSNENGRKCGQSGEKPPGNDLVTKAEDPGDSDQNVADLPEEELKDSGVGNSGGVIEAVTSHSAIFFHSTIFFLWFLVTVMNLPAVLTWAHNFRYSKTLHSDPSFLPGLALSICALPLWQFDFPQKNRKWYEQLGQFLLVVAVVCLVYAPISLYRLNYLLTGVIVLVTLHQLFAPVNADSSSDSLSDGDSDKGHLKYGAVKAKWE